MARVQQGGEARLPALPPDLPPAQLARHRVAGAAPEHHRQHRKAGPAGQKEHPPVQAGQHIPLLRQPADRHQRPAHGAGEEEEQQQLPQKVPPPAEAQPDQTGGGGHLRKKGRGRGQTRQGAQRAVCTAGQGRRQNAAPPHRQAGQPGRDVQRRGVGETVEEKDQIHIDRHDKTSLWTRVV